MSGSFIAPIIIPAVLVPALFAWVFMVFWADSHPEPGTPSPMTESQLSADAVESGAQTAEAAAPVLEPGTDSTPPGEPVPAGLPRQRDRSAAEAAEPRQGVDSGLR